MSEADVVAKERARAIEIVKRNVPAGSLYEGVVETIKAKILEEPKLPCPTCGKPT
jgi:hypothetical protein